MTYRSKFEQYIEFVGTTGGSEYQARCPFHDDEHASLSCNTETGLWSCFACGKRGNWEQFEELIGKQDTPEVPTTEVEEYHRLLINSKEPLDYLIKVRGISKDVIDQYRLGFDGFRFWIPIKDKDGKYVNVRKYRPNDKAKVVGYKKGYNSNRLYPIQNLSKNPVFIMEGEMDTLLALSIGLNAVTQIGGAGSWSKEFNDEFVGKDTYIVYDNDDAGRNGADVVAKQLFNYASSVRVVKLPLNKEKEDFTDYILKYKHTKTDVLAVANSAENLLEEKSKILEEVSLTDNTVYDTTLFESSKAKYFSKLVKVPVLVIGKDLSPYLIPKKILATCRMDAGKKCAMCPLGENNGYQTVEFDEYSQEVLLMLTAPQSTLIGQVKDKLGISCRGISIQVLETFNIEDITAIADVDYAINDIDVDGEYVSSRLFYVGHGLKSNSTYVVEGRVLPDPRNQYATILINKAEPAQDSISAFSVQEVLDDLIVFQVDRSKYGSEYEECNSTE